MAERVRRFKKFDAPVYIQERLAAILPPDDLSVSQWAERHRVLDSRSCSLPGPWRNEKTPYLREIMDELSNADTEEIIFVKPTQVGGTEVLLNMLGWAIMQDPAPAMCVYPSAELAEGIVVNRLEPMVRAAPEINARFDENRSVKLDLQFSGMSIKLRGANSPAQLASFPIRYLFLDEVDKYPAATKREADPISLARERTKTYRNRKIFITSTPTLKTGHIWRALESADVVKHYYVPCPHCGEMIELLWSHVKFPDGEGMSYADRAELAVYACQICGGIITDRHKPQMLRFGEWRDVERTALNPTKVAYWLNSLYSPFCTFSEMTRMFLASKDSPEILQNFVNSWLAEPWEDETLHTDADMVMERQTDLPEAVVPDWAVFITAGVDVQETSMYWTIRAWGPHMTSQNIAHGQALTWREIEQIMCAEYQMSDGTPFIVERCFVDSGYAADEVYDFCVNNQDWAFAVKGSSQPRDSAYTIKKVDRVGPAYGMPLVIVDGGQYKTRIAARLHRENGQGSWMVHAECDMDYANQVTSEHRVNVKVGNRTVEKWMKKRTHGANHFLDCEVYAFAAADSLGLRTLHLADAKEETPKAPEPAQQSTQHGWLSPQSGNWLGLNGKWL